MSSNHLDPEQIAYQYIEGYNEQAESEIIELFSPTVNWEGQPIGREEIDVAVWWEAFPDLQLELHQVISNGSEAAFRFTVRGTHEGVFFDIEPTGKTIESTEMIMISVDEAGIDSLWFEWDELGFFTALGELDHPLT